MARFSMPKVTLPKFPQRRASDIDKKDVSATWLIRLADKAVLFACIGAIVAVYILDAIFFAAWAGDFPTGYLWLVFILIAVVIRTIAVAAPVALQWVRGRDEIRTARTTIRALWIGAVLLCLVPATSFFAGGHKVNTQAAEVAAATETVSTDSKADRIATLNTQIKGVEDRLALDVAEVNVSIDAIMNDGVPGISASDNESLMTLRNEIKGYRDAANLDIEAKRLAIQKIETEAETVKTDAAETEATVSPFMAIFEVVDEMGGPDSDLSSKVVLLLFALLIEAIAAFGLGAYYDIHRVFVRLIRQIQEEEGAPTTAAETPQVADPPAEPQEPAVEPPKADPVDEAIDAATGTEPRPKPRVGDPEKGADSTNFNRETSKLDDSLPIDEPGVADGRAAA